MQTMCCMNCGNCLTWSRGMMCGKRKIGRLYVDAFFCCPLWKPKRRVADE